MRSGANSFNYFLGNKLIKLASLMQFKRMFLSCLENCVCLVYMQLTMTQKRNMCTHFVNYCFTLQ